MAKDPAFLFYSQDFFTGTADMTFEDRGKFITILCLMHQKGRLSEETIRFIVGSVSVSLKSKFEIDKSGLWYNERLEEEISNRQTFVESRRKNGKKGGRPKKSKTIRETYDKPNGKPLGLPKQNLMEDENENAIESINSNKVSEISDSDFENFWNAYGHKVKRALAERAFVEAVRNGAEPQQIRIAASLYSAYCTKTGRRKQDPQNWLAEEAFATDWLEVARNDKSGSKQNEKQATRQTAFEILKSIRENDH